jgi:Putative lumazine-binding
MLCIMKGNLLILSLFAGSLSLQAQTLQDLERLEGAVKTFCQAADVQDVAAMDKVLHPLYRAMLNRVFGSNELQIIDKTTYLELLKTKKIGGDARDIRILYLDVEGDNALVKALFTGKTLRFVTYLSLVKLPDNSWQVAADMPVVSKIEG